MTTLSPQSGGRRARNMRDKQDRIFRAAAELFAERGFEGVSTGQVSERADVAIGTVFRYASSKGELLLMVLNDELRTALETGAERGAAESETAEAVTQMVLPIIEYAHRHPANGLAYQRELLFGSSDDMYRAEGLDLILRLQDRIARRMIDDARKRGLRPDPQLAALAANMIFGVTHLAIARPSTRTHTDHDPIEDIRAQAGVAVEGFFARLTVEDR